MENMPELSEFISGGNKSNNKQRDEMLEDIFDFDNDNQQAEDLFDYEEQDEMNGGAKRRQTQDENAEVVFVDLFTIIESDTGVTGGHYKSRAPRGAALKAAAKLFKTSPGSRSGITFMLQKISPGCNKRIYKYRAVLQKLSKPEYVFKRHENGNKIVLDPSGNPLLINDNNQIVNVNNGVAKKGKKAVSGYIDYVKGESYSGRVVKFDWEPYVIKTVKRKINIKSLEIEKEVRKEYKRAAHNDKTEVKQKAKLREKEALRKAKLAAKNAEKKEREAAKKAEKKEREAAKKAEKKEREAAKKALKKKREAAKKAKKLGGYGCASCSY